MRPEEMTKCQCCKWQGKWNMMLLCAPKMAWEDILKWLEKQDCTMLVETFKEDIRKQLKNYDKARSTK